MTSWIGKSIAHYRVTAQIGAGGMGEVYRASEDFARLSSDGRWILVTSEESGRQEVYAYPYPSLSGRWQVSTAGGRDRVFLPGGRAFPGMGGIAPDGKRVLVAVPQGGTVLKHWQSLLEGLAN